MIFLTSTDFDSVLNAQLKKILVTDNTNIQQAESYAISQIRSYLAGRFNVASIFAQVGASRNPIIVRHVTNLTIYAAQSLISPQNIPAWCKQSRDESLDWLKMVASNELNPDLPLIPGATHSGTFRTGGTKKLTRRF